MSQITFSDLVNGTYPDASDFNTRFNALKNRINNGMEADNIADSAVTTAKINNGAVTYAKFDSQVVAGATTVVAATDDFAFISDTSDSGNVKKSLVSNLFIPTATNALAGSVVQVVNEPYGAVATGTTVLPYDDTVPQNTEGDQYMNKEITPTSATNKLKIDVVIFLASSATGGERISAALFQDSTAGALAVGASIQANSETGVHMICFSHFMTSGTTSATTFKVRAGNTNAGTTTFNGSASARKYGGVLASSITITEIKV